ncbi:DUF4956 domain-containing protein [Clostridium sp. MCC353]|uniref:DUF4956 domain-containing protein n=1 Tax=Clostridium sp. MCC353 TaxID=2592646 RepID=UPI001C0190C6|nr:DUF4956 domain-containing protein [Clostridium sp. MCC353]
MLNSILLTTQTNLSLMEFLLCTGVSILSGLVLAAVHTYKNHCSRNFMMTLVILPAIIQTVIMLVNGNLGTGVAVMGAFSLIRFRSLPGNSREIQSVFLAMAIGLATGMGYLGLAAVLLMIAGGMTVLLILIPGGNTDFSRRELKITIPENLDYYGVFDDVFEKYLKKSELLKVKTVNMGSLFELQYQIDLKHENQEKAFIDDLRCRNGNLPIICGRFAAEREEL